MTARIIIVCLFFLIASVPGRGQEIDPWSGALSLSSQDLVVEAGTMGLDVTRSYAPDGGGSWGDRWRMNWEVTATALTNLFMVQDGIAAWLFEPSGRDAYKSAANGAVTRQKDGGWVWARRDGGRWEFDRGGRMVRRQSRDGTSVVFTYDAQGRLATVQGPFGAKLEFRWDPNGRIETVEGTGGQSARYTYTSNRLSRVSLNGVETAAYLYDAAGRLSVISEPSLGPRRFVYDREGRVIGRSWANGATEAYVRDPASRTVKWVDAYGGVTLFERSADGKRETTTLPDGSAQVRELDDAGRLLALRDGQGNTRQRNTYDSRGRLQRMEDVLGRATVFAYAGDSSDLASLTLPDGAVESYDYDDRGRQIRTRRGGRVVEERQYRQDGLLERTTRGASWEAWTYDAAGRVLTWTASDGRKTTYERNARGQVTRETDAAGLVTVRGYDAQGRVVTETTTPGGTTRHEYGANGLLVKKTGPGGAVTIYRHDARGWLTEMVQPDGGTNRYAYDRAGRLAGVTDALGGITRFEYDAVGNLVRETDPSGGVRERSYDAQGNVVSESDPAGGRTTQVYDGAGRVVKVVNAVGGVTTYAYDDKGLTGVTDPVGRTFTIECGGGCLVRMERDAAGNTWRNEYDGAGRKIRSTDPLGAITEWTYDGAGRLQKVRQPGGGELRYAYDAVGRLARVTEPGGDTLDYAYDARGLVVAETDGAGRVTRYEYDAEGRKIRTLLPGGGQRTLAYDAAGRVTRFVDADGVETRHAYDVAGRRTRTETSGGLATWYSYDAVGNLLCTSNSAGAAEFHTYDAAGREIGRSNRLGRAETFVLSPMGSIVEARDAAGRVRTRRYDAMGALTGARDANGDESAVEFNSAGRIRSVRAPGGGLVNYELNAKGAALRITDSLGRVSSNAYDRAGRLVKSWNARGQEVTFGYDAVGRLTARKTPNGETRFELDAAGRIVRADDGAFPVRVAIGPDGEADRIELEKTGVSIEAKRDGLGRRTRLQAAGLVVDYAYDALGRIGELRVGDARVAFDFDAEGRLASARYPGGLAERRTYNAAGEVERLSLVKGNAVVFEWSGTRDVVGNLTRIRTGDGDQVFAYDAAGQLVDEAGPYGRIRYAYGRGGNRSAVTVGSTAEAWTANVADQVLTAGADSFRYDEDGNLVERSGPSGATRYAYDEANRLVKVTRPDGASVEYGYDHQGLRVWRRDAAGLRYFVYDGVNLVAETDERGKVSTAYVHGFDFNQPLLLVRDGKTYAVHADGNGNVVRVTDQDGAAVASYAYDAFGVPRVSTGSVRCAFRFQGHEYDEAVGLYYCRARWYDPTLGRFLTRDPLPGQALVPLSLNPYAYVLNNPLRYSDPMGTSTRPGSWDTAVASSEAQGVFSGLSSATPYGAPTPVANPIPLPQPGSYQISPTQFPGDPNVLGAYWRHNPTVGPDIQMYPSAGAPGTPKFDATLVHETQHRTDVNRMMRWMADKLDNALDPSDAGDRAILDAELQAADKDYLARLERRAISRETRFLVGQRGLGVNSPEVRGALDYYDQWGNKDQKGQLVRELQRMQGAAERNQQIQLGNSRFQTFMQNANYIAAVASIASCLELKKDPVQCAKEAAIAGIAGQVIGAAIAASGLNPAVVLGAAGIYGWVQVGREANAQWRDYTNRNAQAAANQAQQILNDERVKQTLAGVRGELGKLHALANAASTLYQEALAHAHAGAAAARGSDALAREAQGVAAGVAVAAGACAEANQLLSTIGTRASNAERYEKLVDDGIKAALSLAASCKTQAEADRIMELFNTAAKLVAGIEAMETESKIDSQRIQQIVDVQVDAKGKIAEVAGHPAAIDAKVKEARKEIGEAKSGFANFEKKRLEAEAFKNRLVYQIGALRGAHSALYASDFDALQNEASGVTIQGPSAGDAVATAEGEATRAETAKSTAEAALKSAQSAALCDALSNGEADVGRIGAAHTGAFISFGTGVDLPAQAQACEQALQTNATGGATGGSSGSGTGGSGGGSSSGGTAGGGGWNTGPADPGGDSNDVSQAGNIQTNAAAGGPTGTQGPGAGSGSNSVAVGGGPIGGDLPGQEQSNRTSHVGRPGDHTGRPQSGMGTGAVPDPGAMLTNATGQVAGAAQAAGQAIDTITGGSHGGGSGSGGSGGGSTNQPGGTSTAGTGKPPGGGGGGTGKPPSGGGGGGGTGGGGGGGGGGGTGGGTNMPPGGGGTGTGGTVVVTGTGTAGAGGTSGASGSGSGGYSAAPQDQVIDGSSQLAGRVVTGVKVTLTYDAMSIPDQFQILYGGTLADSGMVSYGGQIVGQGAGNSPEVKIRVISSSNQGTMWNWSASVEYFVK